MAHPLPGSLPKLATSRISRSAESGSARIVPYCWTPPLPAGLGITLNISTRLGTDALSIRYVQNPENVVLVLGAGSSYGFGLPLGNELRHRILNLEHRKEGVDAGFTYSAESRRELHRFLLTFRHSSEDSIDSFLARNGDEFGDIGKRAIAAVLLASENVEKFFTDENDDPWQRYFLRILASPNRWEEVDFSAVKIISFNYDRSLEHFLLVSLQAKFGKQRDEVRQKLRELEIVHVYGSLGAPYPGDGGYISYGRPVSEESVAAAAEFLKVIPEGRDTDASLVRAREILVEAKRLVFLGFSFDPTNIERLHFDGTCCDVVRSKSLLARGVYSSCMGMTLAEKRRLAARIYQNSHSPFLKMETNMFDGNCYRTLRETLALE